jgi:hypothetical protein
LRFVIGEGESILWTGSQLIPKGAKITLAGLVAVFALFQVLGLLRAFTGNLLGADAFVAAAIIFNFMVLLLLRSVRFYVTNRRIVRTTELYVWSRTFQLLLQSIADAKSWQIHGRQYVLFVPSPGYVQVVFGPMKNDAERVREIVNRARSTTA